MIVRFTWIYHITIITSTGTLDDPGSKRNIAARATWVHFTKMGSDDTREALFGGTAVPPARKLENQWGYSNAFRVDVMGIPLKNSVAM